MPHCKNSYKFSFTIISYHYYYLDIKFQLLFLFFSHDLTTYAIQIKTKKRVAKSRFLKHTYFLFSVIFFIFSLFFFCFCMHVACWMYDDFIFCIVERRFKTDDWLSDDYEYDEWITIYWSLLYYYDYYYYIIIVY